MELFEKISAALNVLHPLQTDYEEMELTQERYEAAGDLLNKTHTTIGKLWEPKDPTDAEEVEAAHMIEQGLISNRERYRGIILECRESIQERVTFLLQTIGAIVHAMDEDPFKAPLLLCAHRLNALYERPITETIAFVREQLEAFQETL